MLIEWGLKEKMTLKKMDGSRKGKKKLNSNNELTITKRNNKIRKEGLNPKNTNLSILVKFGT
jgi:hypothetical protein|tara:strand:+ start:53 stop:238 length:186 start_codon:yes stop_codon:yes gene_type:complete